MTQLIDASGIAIAEPVEAPAAGVPSRRGRGRLIRRTLITADLIGLGLAFLIAELLLGSHGRIDRIHGDVEVILFVASLPFWIAGAHLFGLYKQDEQRTDHMTADDLMGVINLVTLGTWLFFGLTDLTGVAHPVFDKLGIFWILAIAFITTGRILGRTFARRRASYVQRALIIGAGNVGQLVAEKLSRHPEYRVKLVGFVDGASYASGPVAPVIGEPTDVMRLVREHGIDRVIFATTEPERDVLVQIVRELHEHDVQVDLVPPLYEVVGPTFGSHAIEGLAVVGLPPLRLTRASRVLKRGVDVALGSILLVLVSPVIALIALAIKLDSKGPVFFKQERVGVGDRRFLILKFRTMYVGSDERKSELEHLNRHLVNGDGRLFKIDDDPRVTRVGRLLRGHYVDELPQLINVIRGDMSLVGPRPLIPEEDVNVGEWGRKRLRLKPGMTGVWQVVARSEVGFEDMIKLDYIYVTNWSLAGDFRLLAQTAGLVARGTGRNV